MLTLYSQQDSGNCYKPRLLMALLRIAFRLEDVDCMAGATRHPEFLAKNLNGKVPLLAFPDGRMLAESNAMLLHLAEGTGYIPADKFDRAKMYEWLFFEQYSHEPAVAVRRSLLVYPQRRAQATPDRLAALLDAGNRAFQVMEQRLSTAAWLAGDSYSIADTALYAYTHMADSGGYDLHPFPGIVGWLDRVAGQPGHVPIEWRPERLEPDRTST